MGCRYSKPDLYFSTAWAGGLRVQCVCVPGAPEFLRGMTALFAADFHLREGVSDARLDRLFSNMADMGADIILLGGDYAEGPRQQARFFEALKGLTAPLGVYLCVGNNDREAFDRGRQIRRSASASGAHLLVNRVESVKIRGGTILVGGVDERKYGMPSKALFPPPGPNRYRILLSHYPYLPGWDRQGMPELMLSGHTHGGQINVLGVTPYVFSRFDNPEMPSGPALISGFARMGETHLLVSPGIGFSQARLRVGVRPKIHLLVF